MSTKSMSSVVFVDLDGTLVLDNSYHAFLWSSWRHGGWKVKSRLLHALATRPFQGHAGRVQMKSRIVNAYSRTTPSRQEAIVTSTSSMLRRTLSLPVLSVIDRFRAEGSAVVLATAALECYARPLALELGFDDCLASSSVIDPSGWVELWGERKAEACSAWARENCSLEARIVAISDDVADLPLLQEASQVVLQMTEEKAIAIAEDLPKHNQIEVIDPVSAEVGGGIWLWILDGPKGPYSTWEVETILSKHRYALAYVGDGRWERVLHGGRLNNAVSRRSCPQPPRAGVRFAIALRRTAVRDVLQIFH